MPNTQPKRHKRRPAAETDAKPSRPESSGVKTPWRARLRDRRRMLGYLWAMLGGLCGALAFDPVALRWLMPLAPLLGFVALRQAPTPAGGFRRIFVLAWILYFGGIQWLTQIKNYAPVPLLATLGIGLLAAYMACYPALGAWALRRWGWTRRPGLQFAAFAAIWLIAEWLRTLGRLAVPLSQLGHAWAVWPWAIQIAGFLGELGVSLLILWIGGILFYWGLFFYARRAGKPIASNKPSLARGIIPTLLLPLWILNSFLLIAGWDGRLRVAEESGEVVPIQVAMVQPNIDQMIKLASYASPDPEQRQQLQEYMNRTQENLLLEAWQARDATHPWDLVILPETAFTDMDFQDNEALHARIGRLARRVGADVFFGAGRIDWDVVPEAYFNSAYLVRRDGEFAAAVYDKVRLVPFGESLPYFDMIPGFRENIAGIGLFTEGAGPVLFELPVKADAIADADSDSREGPTPTTRYEYGSLICFESTFSTMARRLVNLGADFLVVITNDAWYGMSAGAAHHHHLSLLRAVETRRWILRCANTGISSIIDPVGRLQATLPLGEAGVAQGEIYPVKLQKQTIFAKRGNLWLIIPLVLVVLCVVLASRENAPQNAISTPPQPRP